MEKAKAAIKDFTSRTGHHDTTVHETVSPAVQHETVKPHQHENINTAIDKEIHQDHYHHTVQPVKDREVLPEQHTARLGEVQHRTFDNRDHEGVKNKLATETAAFKDHRTVHDTTHSQSAAPTVGGEHVHHHIHETIQPIVQKETVQPHVVHTTVPIHETHHNAAKHHGASTLPAVGIDEFKNRGGVLGGRGERYDAFEGEPKHIGGLAREAKDAVTGHGHSKHDSHHSGTGTGVAGNQVGTGVTGTNSTGTGLGHERGITGDRTGAGLGHHGHEHERTGAGLGSDRTGAGFGNERGVVGSGATRTEAGLGHDKGLNNNSGIAPTGANDGSVGTGIPGRGIHEKSKVGGGPSANPSLKDKLDPRVDADGDGKRGVGN